MCMYVCGGGGGAYMCAVCMQEPTEVRRGISSSGPGVTVMNLGMGAGFGPRFSARVANTFNQGTIPPAFRTAGQENERERAHH